MIFKTPKCPTCGELAIGTADTIPGIALLNLGENGEAEWEGTTNVCWDGQTVDRDKIGDLILTCGSHEWASECDEYPRHDPSPQTAIFDIDRPDAKGKIKFVEDAYGISLYSGDEEQSFASIDLYYQSENGNGEGPYEVQGQPHLLLLLFTADNDDTPVVARFLKDKLFVGINCEYDVVRSLRKEILISIPIKTEEPK